jgi:hypothetical protein
MQMFGWNGIVADLTGDLSPPRAVLVILAIPTLALVFWRWRGDWDYQRLRLPGVLGLTLVGSLLINPHLYFYDMTLGALALALGAMQRLRSDGSLGYWPWLAVAFWFAQVPLPGASYHHGIPLVSLAALALFCLLWISNRGTLQESPAVAERTVSSTSLAA